MSTFFWIAAVTVLLDQLSKLAMISMFRPVVQSIDGGPVLVDAANPIVLIPDIFQFMFRINTGAAWSALTGHTGFLSIISLVISLFVVAWAWFLKPGEQGLRLSQGLIFGGAVGNLIDRFYRGYVIDFIDVHWREAYHYPTFNIADSAICVGIFLLAVASFCVDPPAEQAPPTASPKKSSEAS